MRSSRKKQPRIAAPEGLEFLAGGGDLGEQMRGLDWAKTALGPADKWPQSLRTAVSICLQSRFPIFVWWGPELVNLYNDAYRPILGDKHPRSLGRPARDSWSEIWPVIGPMVESVVARGEATWAEDQLLLMSRYGYEEETYFTFSYSPIRDESGGVGGVFCACVETTERVLRARHLATLRGLSSLPKQATPHDAGRAAIAALQDNPHDLPFALLYLREDTGLRLVGSYGLPAGSNLAPAHLDPDASAPWPVRDVLAASALVRTCEGDFGVARKAVAIPLPAAVGPAEGLFIAGISPRRALNEEYRSFLQLVAGQLMTAIGDARAFETERRRAESLAELDRAKTAFFSNVSHEFRTPLTLILGPLEEVLAPGAPALPPEAAAHLETVARNSRRLLRLVNTMLEFSRIEAGRARAAFEPTDLATLTRDLASVFRSAVDRAGLSMEVDCRPLPAPVYVDPDMWEKIVLNLLSNAFKYTFTGGISVTQRADEDRVILTVRDTGVGIPAEAIPRLFERFYRVENSRSRTQEGTGIGLALVNELVRLHGGTIRAESRLGEGATFTVELPLGDRHLEPASVQRHGTARRHGASSLAFTEEALSWLADAPRVRPTGGSRSPLPAAAPLPAGDRPRIVVAEDNADMREYLSRILSEQFELVLAADGRAALAAIRASRPELVLTDVMMPEVDGFQLLQEIREDSALSTLPVILLSARAGEESRLEGALRGADDYLVKPFSARELVVRVEAQVKMARLRAVAARELHAEMAQREQAHEGMRRRTAQFETLFNQAPIGIYLVDADLRIREVNPVARPVFGAIPDLIGSDFAEVIRRLWTPDYAEELIRIFRHTLKTGVPYVTPERAEQRLDRGVVEFYAWRADRILLPDGRYGVVCYFRDISAQVLAERQLEEARDSALEASRAKDVFLATLSHELRTPLSPVLLLASESSQDDSLPERVRADFRMIGDHVALQARMIDDLLDLSRLSRGKLALDLGPLDLHALLRDAVATLAEDARAAGLELHFDLQATAPRVNGDPVRLRQVVWNILKNALKFTPRGGRIEVSTRDADGQVEARFRDTGVGMRPEDLLRVFQPFVQAKLPSGAHQSGGGLGLGLAIARMLVEGHGGTLVAESDGPGHGSTFAFRLPRGSALTLGNGVPAADAHESGLPESRRVLFVEDNLATQATLVRLLTRRGYLVTATSSVEEALREAGHGRFDVLISDLGLPDGDGCEVMSELRKRQPGLPGIAISGYGMAGDVERSRLAGFREHLTKPITFDALERALLRAIRASSMPWGRMREDVSPSPKPSATT